MITKRTNPKKHLVALSCATALATFTLVARPAFADEAKKRTEELLKNAKKIEGSFDVGDHADKYDRALMYVYVDGKLLQDILIEEGLARVGYAYEPNTSLLKQFQEIEKKAKKRKKNIWEKDGYVTNKGFDTSVYK